MNAPIGPSGPILPPPMPPTAPRGALRAWVWHPRADVGPKLVTVLRVLKGRGIVVIVDPDKPEKEYGIPVAWLFCPAEAERLHV